MDNFDLKKFLVENRLTRNSQELSAKEVKEASNSRKVVPVVGQYRGLDEVHVMNIVEQDGVTFVQDVTQGYASGDNSINYSDEDVIAAFNCDLETAIKEGENFGVWEFKGGKLHEIDSELMDSFYDEMETNYGTPEEEV